VLFLDELTEFRRDAIKDGERPLNANDKEAICEFFGWPDARSRPVGIR
jgi:hypothetical protein